MNEKGNSVGPAAASNPYAGPYEAPPPYSAQAPPVVQDDGAQMGFSARKPEYPPAVEPGFQGIPPQAPYGTAPIPPGTVIHVVQQQSISLGSRSTRLICPHCRADVSTRVNFRHGTFTYIAAIVGFLICCPCGFIPFCIDECQDTEHYCPNCQHYIGLHRR